MRPKGKLFALLAIFVAIGLVTATGAFTSVSATRTAEVNVAGDSAALLQLQPHPGPNGYNSDNSGTAGDSQGYAELDTNGELRINFDGFANTNIGSGPNLNATTDIQNVFTITNQGTQTVAVNVTDSGLNNGAVTFYNASYANHPNGLETDDGGSGVILDPGETLVVSIYIDTEGLDLGDGDELVDTITVEATTNTAVANSGPP